MADPTLLTREEIAAAADGDFIAHARTDLPRALAMARAYLDLVERIEAKLTEHADEGLPCGCLMCHEYRDLLPQKEPTE